MVKEIGGVEERVLGVVGTMYRETAYYESMPGVERAVPISKPYKLVSRELHPAASIIKVGDVAIGGDRLVVIAGPCGVEDRKTNSGYCARSAQTRRRTVPGRGVQTSDLALMPSRVWGRRG